MTTTPQLDSAPSQARGWPRWWPLLAVLLACGLGILLLAGPDRGLPSALEPPPPSEMDPPIPQPTSELNVPIILNLDGFSPGLEEGVPRTFGGMDERQEIPSVPGLSFAFEAERSEFELEILEDTLQLATTLEYRGRGWYESGFLPTITGGCPSSGGVRPRMRATVAVTFEPTPDWRLGPGLELKELRPLTNRAEDRCQVGQMGLELTDGLLALLGEGITSELGRTESELAEASLRDEMEAVWSQMGEAIPVGSGVWLLLDPSSIRVGGISRAGGTNSQLRVDVGLTAQPRLVVAPDPPASSPRPLPPLRTGAGSRGADAVVMTSVSHQILSSLLQDEVVGRGFSRMGLETVVREARVWGLPDGRGVVEMEMDGALRGRVWLVGSLDLDPDRETVSLSHMELHLSSRNVLLRAAHRLFGGMLVRRMEGHATFPTEDLVPSEGVAGTGPLAQELAPGLVLRGEFGPVRTEGIRISPSGIHLSSRVASALTLHVSE